ncbi:hypothetical protein MJ574_12050 [Escherichia coli]|nr:hypothetical protein MJ574_12050 [Escherichia coli]
MPLTSSRQSSTVAKEAPLAVELDHDKVMNMQVKAEFYSEVLTIVVDGKEIKVKAQDVQRHPVQTEAAAHRLRSRLIAE